MEVVVTGAALWAFARWHFVDRTNESFATVVAAFVGFVAAIGHSGYVVGGRGIKLKIVVDNSADCLPLSTKEWADGGTKQRRFVRIKLYNHSRGVAHNTAIKLMGIAEWYVGGDRRLDYSNPHFLRWNGEGRPRPYQKKAMPHGGPQYADVLFTEVSEGQARVVLTDENYTPVGLALEHTYRFVVQAIADDATSVTRRFYVKLGGRYDDITIYRFGWVAWASAVWNGVNRDTGTT